MSFFDKIFGKKKPASGSAPSEVPPSHADQQEVPAAKTDPANDPNMIKVFDEYGREMYVSRDQWRDNVLLGNLQKHRDNPDQLYSMLVGALDDGFAADIVENAEHLKAIDPIPSRSATILAIVYMKVGRLDDARRVLEQYISEHGEEGIVLTNLAKVYSLSGDNERAEETLWHALELDPNQDNGLIWYLGIQRERGGEADELDALSRVAALPDSWRARLWLARYALQRKDAASAETLYQQALSLSGDPVPADLLMQMSGDLGNSGYLADIVRLVAPRFNPTYHGIQVGSNLMKAYVEMGQLAEARELLKYLYDQKRPDWKQALNFWETELAKAETARKAAEPGKQVDIAMVSIEGPLWMREGSPFASLLRSKSLVASRIGIFGSTAIMDKNENEPALHLSDAAGRLSRSVPVMIAELIHLTTDAIGVAMIPWAQGKGFALFGDTMKDKALAGVAGQGEEAPDFVIGATLDTTQSTWMLDLRLIRRKDGSRVSEGALEVDLENLGALIENLSKLLDAMLTKYAGVKLYDPPEWYQLPGGSRGAEYLLRLEQQLTVACNNLDFLDGAALFGEREILDGALQLCANQPKNPTVRMLFVQTLRLMKKARPDILAEYREKVSHLQRDYPLSDEIEALVEEGIEEAFSG